MRRGCQLRRARSVQQRIVPVRLTESTSSNTASSCSASRRMMPAQFTRTSSRGRSRSARALARRRERRARSRRGPRRSGAARVPPRRPLRVAPVTVTTAPACARACGDCGADAARSADDQRDPAREHVVAKGGHGRVEGDPARRRASCGNRPLDVRRARQRRDGAITGRRERRGGVGVARGGESVVALRPCALRNAPSKQSPAPVASTAATRTPAMRSRRAPSETRQPSRPSFSATTAHPSAWQASTMRDGIVVAEQEPRVVEARQRPVGHPQRFEDDRLRARKRPQLEPQIRIVGNVRAGCARRIDRGKARVARRREIAWLIAERCSTRAARSTSSGSDAGVMRDAADPLRRYENSWPLGAMRNEIHAGRRSRRRRHAVASPRLRRSTARAAGARRRRCRRA